MVCPITQSDRNNIRHAQRNLKILQHKATKLDRLTRSPARKWIRVSPTITLFVQSRSPHGAVHFCKKHFYTKLNNSAAFLAAQISSDVFVPRVHYNVEQCGPLIAPPTFGRKWCPSYVFRFRKKRLAATLRGSRPGVQSASLMTSLMTS